MDGAVGVAVVEGAGCFDEYVADLVAVGGFDDEVGAAETFEFKGEGVALGGVDGHLADFVAVQVSDVG